MTIVTPPPTPDVGTVAPSGSGPDQPNARITLTPIMGVRMMLELPEAGDRIARRWAVIAVALYFGLGLLLALTLAGTESFAGFLGLGETKNWVVFALIMTGIAVTLYAFWRVYLDIQHMGLEEKDVDWVSRTGREGLRGVFAHPSQRDAALKHGTMPPSAEENIETLIDDRVRRKQRALRSGEVSSVSVSELRAIAEKRTSRYGELARYLSSFLLLLAVLGTFAGVKAALPGLIQALSGQFTAGDTSGLTAPLTAVAGAFGGNALALVGAIALGLAAQGLAFGRRNLLERLELVSVEYIYGSETAGSADPMQMAVQSLQSSAHELQSLSATLVGVETGLERLGADFRGSLGQLTGDLRELADRQDDALYTQTGQALDSLQQRVGEMATVVEANSHVSARLIDSVQLRADEAGKATGALRVSHEQVALSLDAFVSASTSAQEMFDRARERFGAMTDIADRMNATTEAMTSGVAELQAAVTAASTTNTNVAATLSDALTSRITQLKDVIDAANTSSTQVAEQLGAIMARSREGDDRTYKAVLEVSQAVQDQTAALMKATTVLPGVGRVVETIPAAYKSSAPSQGGQAPSTPTTESPQLLAVLQDISRKLASAADGRRASVTLDSRDSVAGMSESEAVPLLREIARKLDTLHILTPSPPTMRWLASGAIIAGVSASGVLYLLFRFL